MRLSRLVALAPRELPQARPPVPRRLPSPPLLRRARARLRLPPARLQLLPPGQRLLLRRPLLLLPPALLSRRCSLRLGLVLSQGFLRVFVRSLSMQKGVLYEVAQQVKQALIKMMEQAHVKSDFAI